MSDNPHVMSKYASELDCLRERDRWHIDRITALEAKVRELEAERDAYKLVAEGEKLDAYQAMQEEITASRQQVERLMEALTRCLDTYSRTSKRIPPTTQEAEKMLDDIREANQNAREALSAVEKEPKP